MKSVNTALQIKYKNFSYYQQKYLRKLQEPTSVIDPLNSLCGGWFLQTFKQVINKLSTNKSSPLPLFFPNPQSMQLVTKNKNLREQIFQSFDTRGQKRIDACQLYCALILVSKGSYQAFWKTVVDVFGFESPGRILKTEFFFFLDCLFRAIPKIIIIKDYLKPIQPNVRLQSSQILRMMQPIFRDKNEYERNYFYEEVLKQGELTEFLKYIQKRCNGSAEKTRNQTIEKVALEKEVKEWLNIQLDKIQSTLNQHREDIFQRILD